MVRIRKPSMLYLGRASLQAAPITAMILLGSMLAAPLHGHECGPANIQLTVGQTAAWRIVADLTETTTQYVPTLTGDTNAVQVNPLRHFNSHSGDFVIFAAAPGVAILSVTWTYVPTGAVSVCAVQIEVFPPGVLDTGPTLGTNSDGSIDDGRLSLFDGRSSIPSRAVAGMIRYFVPESTPKLLVLAQCFGGNMAFAPQVASLPNTAILSATSLGQWAYYGGYHDDAARALFPAPGRTALDVHNAGSIGKRSLEESEDGTPLERGDQHYSSEWPLISGSLAPGAFLLEPITATTSVRSRHIVVYAGKPDIQNPRLENHDGFTLPISRGQRAEIRDTADRDAIKDNFANQPATTVHTAGGPPNPEDRRNGQDGWDHSGTLDGLQAAIQAAAAHIQSASDPAREQFILFVGDHGVTGNSTSAPSDTLIPPGTRSAIGQEHVAWTPDHPAVRHMLTDPANQPAFSLWFDFDAAPIDFMRAADGVPLPPLDLDLLRLDIESVQGSMSLWPSLSQPLDLDDDLRLGSVPGEGLDVTFPLAEDALLGQLIGHPFDLFLRNGTSRELVLSDITLTTGSVARAMADVVAPLRLIPLPRPQNGSFEFLVTGEPGGTVQIHRAVTPDAFLPWLVVSMSSPIVGVQDDEFSAHEGRAFYWGSSMALLLLGLPDKQ
jgi:hypothetical protein